MKLLIIIGTRPNFIKVTRFKEVAATIEGFSVEIVHTGQHYDQKMSGVFFDQFELQPDYFLSLRGDDSSSQFGNMIVDIGELIKTIKPDIVMVPGDVNSSLAGALAAHRCGVKIAHLESGLRSRDREMPEEINRILIDQISDYHFVTEKSGIENLLNEGFSSPFLVGNTMIDTLVKHGGDIEKSSILEDCNVTKREYGLITMHRPSNVDNKDGVLFIITMLESLVQKCSLVFPIHPRTRKNIEELGLWTKLSSIPGVVITEPLSYFDFQKLISDSRFVVTDSGGIQEETTFCKIPCVTIRENTERPITIEIGTNHLVGRDLPAILNAIDNPKNGIVPEKWDGKTTERVIEILSQ
ncbi:MAG: UDP-N-acetylglucosamine 2-epimerase (non-hydrolyzing) [Bacteroidetes bacterium]|nr:MAG: UDP-N-acetylglucosamine 2-epimerase (non-hydrolyzing) [Bacteroidota bacterium]